MARILSAICVLVSAAALAACHQVPEYESRYADPTNSSASPSASPSETSGPLGTALTGEIRAASDASDWPELEPPMEAVINGPEVTPDIEACGRGAVPPGRCTWGDPGAEVRAVLVGDSIAMSYAAAFRDIAENSGRRLQVHLAALPGCGLADDLLHDDDKALMDSCPVRRAATLDYIAKNRPDVVFISHEYGLKYLATGPELTPGKWTESLQRATEKFSTGRIVLLAAPPAEKDIAACFPEPASTPQKCASLVNRRWHSVANAERDVAKTAGWTWIDSRPWFCSDGKVCPAFVSTTPTKSDFTHITTAYAVKMAPVIDETLRQAGVF